MPKRTEYAFYCRYRSVIVALSYFSHHSLHGWRHVHLGSTNKKTKKHSLSPDRHRQTYKSTVQEQSYAKDRATAKC